MGEDGSILGLNGHPLKGYKYRPDKKNRRLWYRRTTLKVGDKYVSCYWHQVVLETFKGLRPDGTVTRHVDGNGLNNAVGNLEWGTQAENCEDRERHRRERLAVARPHPRRQDRFTL